MPYHIRILPTKIASAATLLMLAGCSLAGAQQIPPTWATEYEKSGFVRTGRYAEAVTFCERLAKASPDKARVIRFGTSPQGRPLIALLLTGDKSFTPQKAAASPRPLIIINNGIHSGEIEGKDADLILARDILVSHRHKEILASINLLIIPVFSVDAHERFGPYNRINQNGPERMGWRATAQNLNLNRDWMKADADEMRAMLHLLHTWKPDFFFDNHTTDGADWQYTVQLDVPVGPTLAEGGVKWAKGMLKGALPAVENDGFLTAPYFDDVNYTRLQEGLSVSDFGPRYSTGYLAAINRPSMLVETHMLKSYKQRVNATYSINLHVIEYAARTAAGLKAANRRADTAEKQLKPGAPVVLTSETSKETRPFTFKGLEYRPYRSKLTGSLIPAWTRTPVDTETTIRDQYLPGLTVEAPAGYAIPPEWSEIIARLDYHGIAYKRLSRPLAAPFETSRFESIKFPSEPFESRFQPQFKARLVKEPLTLPAGTAIVPINQVGAKLIMQLLEPEAPDSLLRWGLLNAIFERKEYFETYALEPIAVKLLQNNPELKEQFDAMMQKPEFAGNARAKLDWLYEHSPYADKAWNRYPIIRLSAEQLSRALPGR
jgi:Zinc carboxypeptidase